MLFLTKMTNILYFNVISLDNIIVHCVTPLKWSSHPTYYQLKKKKLYIYITYYTLSRTLAQEEIKRSALLLPLAIKASPGIFQ